MQTCTSSKKCFEQTKELLLYAHFFFFLFDSFDCLNGIGSTYIVEESVALEMLLAKVRAQHSSEQHYTEKSRRNRGGPSTPQILHIS